MGEGDGKTGRGRGFEVGGFGVWVHYDGIHHLGTDVRLPEEGGGVGQANVSYIDEVPVSVLAKLLPSSALPVGLPEQQTLRAPVPVEARCPTFQHSTLVVFTWK